MGNVGIVSKFCPITLTLFFLLGNYGIESNNSVMNCIFV